MKNRHYNSIAVHFKILKIKRVERGDEDGKRKEGREGEGNEETEGMEVKEGRGTLNKQRGFMRLGKLFESKIMNEKFS